MQITDIELGSRVRLIQKSVLLSHTFETIIDTWPCFQEKLQSKP